MASPEKLVELLKGAQQPDTNNLRAITTELQDNYYPNPATLLWLVRIATAADAGADRDVRLQAAIHAARLVPRHWTPNPEGGEKDSSPGIPTDQKPQVRNHLVQSALEESDPKVRHQLARLIAEIAELDAPQNEWPDLVPGVLRLAESSESAAHREMATFVLHSLLENDADSFKELVPQILALLAKTLRDPESADVRVNSMLAAGSIVLLLDENEEEDAGKDEASREALRGLVPDMVEVLRAAIDADDDDKMRSAFEVLQTFLMVDSALLSTAYLKELMTYMADVAGDANRSTDARNQALSFLCQCVRYRRMKIQGMRDMGSALTVRALQVLTELDADEEEVDESTPPAYALELLGELADNLPPRQVCVAVLDKLPALAKHENPAYREAAVLALGKTAEGGPDFVTTQLKTIMPIVLALLNDANVMVRLYSLDALVQMADSIHTELAPYHAPLIEGVAKNIEFARTAAQSGQVDEKVATRLLSACCRSIDAMSGAFEDETLEKYAPALIEQMRDMMSAPAHRIKAAAAGALGAIAVAMGDKFRPYFEATMAALSPYVAIKETEDDMTLRAQVCDSIGRIATAAGRELMQPYVRDLMAASEEGLKLDFARLRETSFLLWGTLAEVYETDFGVFLEGVMKALFEALEESEVDLEEKVDDALNAAINKSKKASGADDDDDDDDDDESAIALVDWTEAQEQAVAAQALGDVLVHACTKEDLTRYLEKAVELVSGMVNNQYEDCRHAAIGVLWRAYARVWQIWEEETGIKWAPGFPPRDKQGNLIELSPVISKLGFVTTQATLSIWGEEPDRDVVVNINENIRSTLEVCGPSLFLHHDQMLQETLDTLQAIITRTHTCLQDLGDEDDEEEIEVEGTSEEDWQVVDTALDAIIGVAGAMGSNFGELWKLFEKTIVKLASADEARERSAAVGTIAQCIAFMGASVTPYTPRLLKVLVHRLADEDSDVKANAAFGLGLLLLHSEDSATYLPQYNTILAKLEPLLSVTDAPRLLDNAAGCVARMITAHPDKVPLAQVLPALIDILPLKEDYEENIPVYECLFKLYDLNEPTTLQLTPRLIPVFEKVLGPPENQLEPETREKLLTLVTLLFKTDPSIFQGNPNLVQMVGL